LVIALIATSVAPRSHAQTLPEAFRKIFASPTPAPAHKRKTTSSPAKQKQSSPTPTPSPRPKKKKSDEASPTPTPAESPSATPSPSAKAKRKKKAQEASPTPTPTPSETPAPAPSASVAPPPEKKKGAPATVPPEQIAEYPNYPPNVRKIADLSLDLTRRNLEYKYGSADPANGGMDCSGFVYYVLTQSGVPDVPRDSSQQYVAVRKAGTFRAVNSRRDDSFELDELRPGDLLFWTGTYSIERDPPITHSMIYLGREKGSNKRIMVGASDGRVYNGESRFGVSVFDFKIAQPPRDNDAKLHPIFIGYGHVPGLQQ
jgi:cell wall-associated NlpC family hydrolase